MKNSFISMLKQHPLLFYLLFTFFLSWGFWTIPVLLSLGVYTNYSLSSAFGLGVLSPVIIAVLLSTKVLGGRGLKDLGSRFSLKGVHLKWYLIATFSFVIVSIAALFICFLLDGTPERVFDYYSFSNFLSTLPVLMLFASFEEVGWRGFALPRLREKLNALTASMVLGVIWVVWHFPKLISEGTTDICSFIVLVFFGILFSVFLSWIYENSSGSISLAILAHASGNAAIYGISPEILTKIGYNSPSIIFTITLLVLVAAVIFFNGVDLKKGKEARQKKIIKSLAI